MEGVEREGWGGEGGKGGKGKGKEIEREGNIPPFPRMQRSFNEMQTWITELRQLGPQNLVLAITGNKLDLESARQVSLKNNNILLYVRVCTCSACPFVL